MGEDISLQIPEEPVLILRGICGLLLNILSILGTHFDAMTSLPAQGLDALYIITTALSGSFSILAWVTCLALAIHVSKTGDDVGI